MEAYLKKKKQQRTGSSVLFSEIYLVLPCHIGVTYVQATGTRNSYP